MFRQHEHLLLAVGGRQDDQVLQGMHRALGLTMSVATDAATPPLLRRRRRRRAHHGRGVTTAGRRHDRRGQRVDHVAALGPHKLGFVAVRELSGLQVDHLGGGVQRPRQVAGGVSSSSSSSSSEGTWRCGPRDAVAVAVSPVVVAVAVDIAADVVRGGVHHGRDRDHLGKFEMESE